MEYLFPIISVSCAFIATLLCIIFIFSKRFFLWICPLLLCLVVMASDVLFLHSLANSVLVSVKATILDYITFLSLTISVLLLFTVVVLRVCALPDETQKRKDRRSKSEAKYVSIGSTKRKA